MNIETGLQSKYNSISIKAPTPHGNMFVMIMEGENGKPVAIQLNIGKAGNELSAMAHALARVCTLAIEGGAGVSDLIQELSNHTTDRSVMASNGATIRSVIDALVWALIEYNRERYAAKLRAIGDWHPRLGG